MRMRRCTKAIAACLAPLLLIAAAPTWTPDPWLEDLAQIRTAVETDYPNRDWLTGEREVSLDRWFERTAADIRASHNDADARRAFDILIERFNDGHVSIDWPEPKFAEDNAGSNQSVPVPVTSISEFCAARGYDAAQVTTGTASVMPNYRAIDGGGPFKAGLVSVNGRSIGVVRIGAFSPQGYPAVCEQAVAKLQIAFQQPCDAACDDRLSAEAFAIMTRGLMTTIERLRAAGAQVLMIDITRNGGGTEWAEAAARIVSPVPLSSAPIAVIRGDAWVRRWNDLAARLRKEAERTSGADRARLFEYAARAAATASGLRPCAGSPCSRLARAGFASGLLAAMPSGELDRKTWGADVFSPAQFPYHDSFWTGPLIVLVDDETWSAAEQFAALLQDNNAAVVMGTRTGGAGCGHLDGNEPITLTHSKAKLEMPNCVRLRKDGTNEVSGIVPEVPTGVRWNDGLIFAGRLSSARLPEAVDRAIDLQTHHKR
jgi:Peptidase family S41